MAGKKHKSGVQPFSWEIDDNKPQTAAPEAEPPKKTRKKAAPQFEETREEPAVSVPEPKTGSTISRRRIPSAKAPEHTLETLFPIIGEKFPNILTPDGEMAEIGKGLSDHIGFASSYRPVREIVRDAMFYSPLGRGKKREDIPDKDVNQLLGLVAEQLASPEFKFYQDTISIPVWVDLGITKFLNKGMVGIVFYGMRNSKPTNDGLRAFDIISKIEDAAINIGVGTNLYQMWRAHKMYNEEIAETTGDIITNPMLRRQLLLSGYSIALPVVADALEAPDMGSYFNEHYVKHLKNFTGVKEGDTGFVASIVNTLEGWLLSYAQEAGEKAKVTTDMLKDAKSPLVADIARIAKGEVADVTKFTAGAARASEIFLFSNPLTTIHTGGAIVYDMAELTLQARFAGKHLEGGKLQSLYEGDRK